MTRANHRWRDVDGQAIGGAWGLWAIQPRPAARLLAGGSHDGLKIVSQHQ